MRTLVWITVSRLLDLYYYNTIVNYLAHVHQIALSNKLTSLSKDGFTDMQLHCPSES